MSAERWSCTVTVTAPSNPDLALEELEDLESLESELSELLRAGRPLSLDFTTAPGPRLSPLDAADVLRKLTDQNPNHPGGTIHCRSSKAADVILKRVNAASAGVRIATFGWIRVEVTSANIVDCAGDAAVNASNSSLILGSGVSGALGRAAGPDLQRAMSALAPIGPRTLVETSSFGHTKVKKIFHVPTVRGVEDIVRHAYRNVLVTSRKQGLRTVVLPSLGTGSGGMSPALGAVILRHEIEALAAQERPPIGELRLILALYDARTADVFAEALGATA